MYFISPSLASLQALCADFADKDKEQRLYARAHVFFSSPISPAHLATLKQCKGLVESLASLAELNLEYQTKDMHTFTTGQPGLVFGLTDFDLRIDNVTITVDQPPACPADLNGDGFVDAADMGAMLALWGEAESAADLNEDGAVDAQDLGLLLVEWGPCS